VLKRQTYNVKGICNESLVIMHGAGDVQVHLTQGFIVDTVQSVKQSLLN
jgi:hypothetical protein